MGLFLLFDPDHHPFAIDISDLEENDLLQRANHKTSSHDLCAGVLPDIGYPGRRSGGIRNDVLILRILRLDG
jgi:hypothetical protein